MAVDDLFSLCDKTALVTGCAEGIGASIATALARAGAQVIGFDIGSMQETATKISSDGGTFNGYRVDLSDTEEISRTWNTALAEQGGIDILVNNAGYQYRAPAIDFPDEQFEKIFAVNMNAPYQLSQLAVKHFLATERRGKIINIASLFSSFGGINVSAYTCSKHAVMGLTRAFSNEYSPMGITVNAIAPGYVATKITRSIWSDSEKNAPILSRIPIGRWATGEDFAGISIFLASSASDYITGVMIPVDGGYSVR